MVAIYARQSIEKKDSISIESQIERCIARVEPGEEHKVYQDSGYSGGTISRPAFQDMLRDVEQGAIHKIIVYKLDRISRSILDFSNIQQKLDEHGVSFISCSETIDTSTPQGRAMLNMTMTFAQFERETIQERIRDNYYARGRQGFYLGGRAPFGYDKIETIHNGKGTYTFAENEQQAPIVRQIFAEYATTDISLGKLAARQTGAGLYTNTGSAWSGVALGRLLRNPVYVQADAEVYRYLRYKGATMNNDVSEYIGENGCYVYANRKEISTSKFTNLSGSYVTLALHKGLISSELWMQCQRKLDKNKQIKNSGKGTHSWLSGLMKCGYCNMAVNVVNNSRGYNYINCGGRKLRICYERKRVIRLEEIEDAVKEQLFHRISHLKANPAMQDTGTDSVEENGLKIELTQIEEQMSHIVEQIVNGSATVQKMLNERVEQLEVRRKVIEKELLDLAEKRQAPRYEGLDLSTILAEWGGYSFDTKKQLAHAFIETVHITDDMIQVKFH